MNAKYDKLKEARYFLKKMRGNAGDQSEFNYNLSAFLTAARSVLQYVYEDVKDDRSAKLWYDDTISRNPNLQRLKELRDPNIHVKPVTTTKHATSGGQRTHFFGSDTEEEVIGKTEQFLSEIEALLKDGITNGYLLNN